MRVTYSFSSYEKTHGGHITLYVDNYRMWHPAVAPRELTALIEAVREEFSAEFSSGAMGRQGFLPRKGFETFDQCDFFVQRGTLVERVVAFIEEFGIRQIKGERKLPKVYADAAQLKEAALQQVRDAERDAANRAKYEATAKQWAASARSRKSFKKEFVGPTDLRHLSDAFSPETPYPPIEYPPDATKGEKFVSHMQRLGQAMKDAGDEAQVEKPAKAGDEDV